MYFIGSIANTHGLKGDVTIKPRTDFAQRFEVGSKLLLCDNKQQVIQTVTIEKSSIRKGMYYVKFKEFNHINEIEKYKGSDLAISEEQLYDLPQDEFYVFDLKECTVICDNEKIGVVTGVKQTGAHEILEVMSTNEKRILIPFIKVFIKDVSLDKKEIVVNYLEGMW